MLVVMADSNNSYEKTTIHPQIGNICTAANVILHQLEAENPWHYHHKGHNHRRHNLRVVLINTRVFFFGAKGDT